MIPFEDIQPGDRLTVRLDLKPHVQYDGIWPIGHTQYAGKQLTVREKHYSSGCDRKFVFVQEIGYIWGYEMFEESLPDVISGRPQILLVDLLTEQT